MIKNVKNFLAITVATFGLSLLNNGTSILAMNNDCDFLSSNTIQTSYKGNDIQSESEFNEITFSDWDKTKCTEDLGFDQSIDSIKQPFFKNKYCYIISSIISKAYVDLAYFRTSISDIGNGKYKVTVHKLNYNTWTHPEVKVLVDGTFRYTTKNQNAICEGPLWAEVYARALLTVLKIQKSDITNNSSIKHTELDCYKSAFDIFYMMGMNDDRQNIFTRSIDDTANTINTINEIVSKLDAGKPVCFGTKNLLKLIPLYLQGKFYIPSHQYSILCYGRKNRKEENEIIFNIRDPHGKYFFEKATNILAIAENIIY